SATLGGLCHKASARPLTRPSRLSATRLTDNYLGGTSTHWRSAPLGRTQHSRSRGISSCVFKNIPASPASFPQRPFVFNNIQASVVQKKISSNCSPLLRVDRQQNTPAN